VNKLARAIWEHFNITGLVIIALFSVVGYFTLPLDAFKWLGISLVSILLMVRGLKSGSGTAFGKWIHMVALLAAIIVVLGVFWILYALFLWDGR